MAVCLRPLGFCSQPLGIEGTQLIVKDQDQDQDQDEPRSSATWRSGQRAGP